MKILQQSQTLRLAFQEKIDDKKSTKRQEVNQALGNGIFGKIGSVIYDLHQAKNQFKGNAGEWGINLIQLENWSFGKNKVL